MLLLQTFNKTPRRRETIGEGKPKENLMEDLRVRWPQPRAQASGASVPAPEHRLPGVSPWSVLINAASVCTLIRRQTNGHAGLLSLFSVACLPCIVRKTTKGCVVYSVFQTSAIQSTISFFPRAVEKSFLSFCFLSSKNQLWIQSRARAWSSIDREEPGKR